MGKGSPERPPITFEAQQVPQQQVVSESHAVEGTPLGSGFEARMEEGFGSMPTAEASKESATQAEATEATREAENEPESTPLYSDYNAKVRDIFTSPQREAINKGIDSANASFDRLRAKTAGKVDETPLFSALKLEDIQNVMARGEQAGAMQKGIDAANVSLTGLRANLAVKQAAEAAANAPVTRRQLLEERRAADKNAEIDLMGGDVDASDRLSKYIDPILKQQDKFWNEEVTSKGRHAKNRTEELVGSPAAFPSSEEWKAPSRDMMDHAVQVLGYDAAPASELPTTSTEQASASDTTQPVEQFDRIVRMDDDSDEKLKKNIVRGVQKAGGNMQAQVHETEEDTTSDPPSSKIVGKDAQGGQKTVGKKTGPKHSAGKWRLRDVFRGRATDKNAVESKPVVQPRGSVEAPQISAAGTKLEDNPNIGQQLTPGETVPAVEEPNVDMEAAESEPAEQTSTPVASSSAPQEPESVAKELASAVREPRGTTRGPAAVATLQSMFAEQQVARGDDTQQKAA